MDSIKYPTFYFYLCSFQGAREVSLIWLFYKANNIRTLKRLLFLCFNTLAWITENVKFRWNTPDKVVNLHHDSLDTLQTLKGSAALCFFPLQVQAPKSLTEQHSLSPNVGVGVPFGYFWEQTENIWVSILWTSSYQCFGLRPTWHAEEKLYCGHKL